MTDTPHSSDLHSAGLPGGLDARRLLDLAQGQASNTTEAKFIAPSPSELQEHFDDLTILERIGQGGMGAVYKAVQPKLDREVALKVMLHGAEADLTFGERFNREARTLARLSHPNIVQIFDFGERSGHCYLLMEYVDGMTLRQLMQMDQVSATEALELVPQMCDALQYAHRHGVVHRDIKPENILVDQAGVVHIADFGLAKLVEDKGMAPTLTQADQIMGTPHYMAPEQIEQPLKVDHRADIFSLGVVFYELLTGQLPLGRFKPPSESAKVGKQVDEAVMRSLEREPDARYQDAGDVKTQVMSKGTPHEGGVEPERTNRFVQPLACYLVAVFLLKMIMLYKLLDVRPVESGRSSPRDTVALDSVVTACLVLLVGVGMWRAWRVVSDMHRRAVHGWRMRFGLVLVTLPIVVAAEVAAYAAARQIPDDGFTFLTQTVAVIGLMAVYIWLISWMDRWYIRHPFDPACE